MRPFSLLAALLLAISPASALDFRSGDRVVVAADETIQGDLFAFAESVVIDGDIQGDLFAFGRKVSVNGRVQGSVTAGGEEVHLRGMVARSGRLGGRAVTLGGALGGDLLLAGSEVRLDRDARVVGDLAFGGETVRLYGPVGGKILGGGGSITLGSEVGGDVDVHAENLALLSSAAIGGDLEYTSPREARLEEGARVQGRIEHKESEESEDEGFFSGFTGEIVGLLMALVAGLVLLLLAPQRVQALADAIGSRPGPSAGWGALVLLLTPPVALVACVTIVGLPLGIMLALLYLMALYLAQIPAGLFVGRWLLGRFLPVEGAGLAFAALALGLVLLRLLEAIPYLGFPVAVAALLVGLGAAVVAARIRLSTPESA